MPTETSWKNYVYAVVRHFKGRGVDYQVWNEANVVGYWQGTAQQMATLTRLASTIVNRNDPSAKVVSPAMAVRLPSQRSWLRTFYAQKTGGKKVATYLDVVSLNLYPLASQKPEASMTLLATTRSILRAAGVRKPIWNTEINYGLLGGGNAKTVAAADPGGLRRAHVPPERGQRREAGLLVLLEPPGAGEHQPHLR